MEALTNQPRAALLTPLQHMKPHPVVRRPKRTLLTETCQKHEAPFNNHEHQGEIMPLIGLASYPTRQRMSEPEGAIAWISARRHHQATRQPTDTGWTSRLTAYRSGYHNQT